MIARLSVMLALVALLPTAAAAQNARGTGDAAAAGTWKLTWNTTVFGSGGTGGHYVQVYSDRRVHWTDSVRPFTARMNPSDFNSPRCEDSTELAPDEFATMRELVRDMYDLHFPDGTTSVGSAYLSLTVTRGGHDYTAAVVHYTPTLENLDPRLRRAQAVFARFACPAGTATARPVS